MTEMMTTLTAQPTWMSNIKDVPMVMVPLSYFSRYGAWCMYEHSRNPKFFRSMGYQIF